MPHNTKMLTLLERGRVYADHYTDWAAGTRSV